MNYIEELQEVIERLHVRAQRTLRLCRLKKNSRGKLSGKGEVEVFDLQDHPQTHRVYAWAHETEDADHPRRHVTVLHILRQPQAHVKPYRRQL